MQSHKRAHSVAVGDDEEEKGKKEKEERVK